MSAYRYYNGAALELLEQGLMLLMKHPWCLKAFAFLWSLMALAATAAVGALLLWQTLAER